MTLKIGTGKVSGSVSENFGTKKKVLVLVSDYLVPKKYRYWYRLKFWVLLHNSENKVKVLDFVKIYEVAAF